MSQPTHPITATAEVIRAEIEFVRILAKTGQTDTQRAAAANRVLHLKAELTQLLATADSPESLITTPTTTHP